METALKDVSQVQDRTYVSYSFDGVVPVSVIHVYGKIRAGKLADAIDNLLIVSILHHRIDSGICRKERCTPTTAYTSHRAKWGV
jgi:hypothetical protein